MNDFPTLKVGKVGPSEEHMKSALVCNEGGKETSTRATDRLTIGQSSRNSCIGLVTSHEQLLPDSPSATNLLNIINTQLTTNKMKSTLK